MDNQVHNRVICPCCGGQFDKFLSYGIRSRPNAKCPACGSKERHRLLWLYLTDRTNLLSERLKVLHLAPERCFLKILATLPNLIYVTADLKSDRAMVKMDILRLPFRSDSFDTILCSHVLEHIVDDRGAMRELLRVLRLGGWAIIQVPVDLKRDRTFEDPKITTPEARERLFGQRDHVRIYGRDYRDRLEEVGFTVRADRYARELGDDAIAKYGLKDKEIYYCMKRRGAVDAGTNAC